MPRYWIGLSAAACLGLTLSAAFQPTPQDLSSDERSAYGQMLRLAAPVEVPGDAEATKSNRAVLAKKARYLVDVLMKKTAEDQMASTLQNFVQNELPVPRGFAPREMEKHLAFARELGPHLVKELEPAVKDNKTLVRLNAARLLAFVGMTGYEGAAALALQILNDPQQPDGVKNYALETLTNLFAFAPDAANADVSVFDQGATGEAKAKNRALRNECIQSLCDFVTKNREIAGRSEEEIAAIKYVRREAVRALGQVRMHRLRDGQPPKVLARPGLVLLKVANRDGLTPEPDVKEQSEAVLGFLNLFPVIRAGADREIQCDYAADAIGRAIVDVMNHKAERPDNIQIPWRVFGERLAAGLEAWQDHVNGMRLDGAAAARPLAEQVKTSIIEPLRANLPGSVPDTNALRTWLQANKAKAETLYKDEPAAKLTTSAG
jgi:hypothetical protein